MTYDTIDAEMGISKNVVYRTCKKSSINERLKEKQEKELEEQIMSLYR